MKKIILEIKGKRYSLKEADPWYLDSARNGYNQASSGGSDTGVPEYDFRPMPPEESDLKKFLSYDWQRKQKVGPFLPWHKLRVTSIGKLLGRFISLGKIDSLIESGILGESPLFAMDAEGGDYDNDDKWEYLFIKPDVESETEVKKIVKFLKAGNIGDEVHYYGGNVIGLWFD